MAAVSLDRAVKTYPNGFRAVHGISIEIANGEFTVIVGPSGCGKSTVLRMIAGLETITEGELRIDGERVNEREPGARDIAMVFQNYALYPHMSVYDNMAYGLRNRRIRRPEIDRKVHEAAQMLHLQGLLSHRPAQLSGGQRQRVAMGRAIVRNPRVFLFDEPLSNLDAKLRVQMRIEIKRLQRTLGVTTVYVTHDQVEAMTLADQLIAMNEGRVEQSGAPLDLYENPATRFVAGFIGSPPINFIPRESLRIGRDRRGAPIPVNAVEIGVRPEHFSLREAEGAPLAGTVQLVESLGAETLVYVRPDGASPDELLTVRCAAGPIPTIEDRIGLAAERMMWFDAGGQRVGGRPGAAS